MVTRLRRLAAEVTARHLCIEPPEPIGVSRAPQRAHLDSCVRCSAAILATSCEQAGVCFPCCTLHHRLPHCRGKSGDSGVNESVAGHRGQWQTNPCCPCTIAVGIIEPRRKELRTFCTVLLAACSLAKYVMSMPSVNMDGWRCFGELAMPWCAIVLDACLDGEDDTIKREVFTLKW